MEQGPLGWLQLVDLVAIQLGSALVLGGWASSRWLRAAGSPWSAHCAGWTTRAVRAGSALGIVGLAAAAWLQAAVMAEVSLRQAGATVLPLLRDTHYGHVSLVGFGAGLVVLVLTWLDASGRAVPLGVLVTAWSRSAVSHAANSGDISVDVWVDVLHLLVTSLWVGVVLVAAGLPRPASTMSDREDASRWVASLSACATFALGVVVLTGLFKVYRAVPTLSVLPGSDYGRALFIKLGLVAVAVLLGGYNRLAVLPSLHDALRQRDGPPLDAWWNARLLTVLRFEAVVLVLVAAWAALLSGTEPPG